MFDPAADTLAESAHYARIDVLCETADLLAVNKPADLVCHPTKTDEWSSLVSRLRIYASGRWEPRLVHRLDRETSGIVLIAKSTGAAAMIGKILETGGFEKRYLAWVHGHPAADTGEIDAPLGRDDASPVAIKDHVRPDGYPARTRYQVVRKIERNGAPFACLDLRPETGRKHQLRIHLAHLGHPIVGDKIYGGDPHIYLRLVEARLTDDDHGLMISSSQMLHAARLTFEIGGATFRFVAPEPAEWGNLGFVHRAD